MRAIFQRLLLKHEIVIWHLNLARPQSYLWWQKKDLSWNGCFILFLPVALQRPLSIYIHYCRSKNSVGFHYFIGTGCTDSVLLSVLTPFFPSPTFTYWKSTNRRNNIHSIMQYKINSSSQIKLSCLAWIEQNCMYRTKNRKKLMNKRDILMIFLYVMIF